MKRPGETADSPNPKRQTPPASANLISLASPADLPSLRSSRTHLENLLKDDSRNQELLSLKQQVDSAIASLEEAEAAGESAAPGGEEDAAAAAPPEEAEPEDPPAPPRWQGVVRSYSGKKGFGFIKPLTGPDGAPVDGGAAAASGEKQDVFVHKNAVVLENGAVGLALSEGQHVSFVLSDASDGRRSALDVRTPEGEPLAAQERTCLDLRAHTESWRGLKDQQEDRYVQGEDLGDLGVYYAVFDGHGGIFSPEYLCKHLHKNILSHRSTLPSIGVKEAEIRKLLHDVFLRTDKDLLKMPGFNKAKDGSTALVAILSGHTCPSKGQPGDLKVYVANVGDCRAVLCRGGRAVRMSEDHKPNRGDEERRVRAAGGYVVNLGGVWRVTTASGAGAGVNLKDHQYLAVSRSFGDVELKQPNHLIVSTPEIKVFDVTEEDCFLVLACDGIWDMLDDQEVVDIAGEYFGRPQDAAASIVRTAYQKGSGDNLTATVVEFGWVTQQMCKDMLENYAKSREGPEEDLDMFGD